MNIFRKLPYALLTFAAFVAGCTALPAPVSTPVSTSALNVTLRYPGPKTGVEMGQGLRFIAQVTDQQGRPVTDARVTLAVRENDTNNAIATLDGISDSEGIYRGGPWLVPHRIPEGTLQLSLIARRGSDAGQASGSVQIKYSLSDKLLNKYGFWLDAPTLKRIVPSLYGEQGDARNGVILWGGQIPAQHILPENWVEVHWRSGQYNLEDAEAARRFALEDVGNLGFTHIRSIEPFEPFQFKSWRGWKASARPQTQPTQVEFVVFYAPEVDKTYLIGTTVTLPPVGIDPHATLRASFEVHPEIHASGVAPEPLPDLLPGPELLEPPLATRFYGTKEPIILRWRPIKDLASDEYYEVSVDYNDAETNDLVTFDTRDTQLILPLELYQKPNCGVFNWSVTLMRRPEAGASDQSPAKPLSYPSLYWYVEWRYPRGEEAPFISRCPNAQF